MTSTQRCFKMPESQFLQAVDPLTFEGFRLLLTGLSLSEKQNIGQYR